MHNARLDGTARLGGEMEQIDTAVIGGGVVGLAAALALARRGRSVCVLER
jgi:glycine/D-amino acid oxidase-like deaminating enzyme